MMFAVNIYILSVTNFCHFLLYNLVKNLPLFIPIVSALCHYFLGFINTSHFFVEAIVDKIIHLSQFFITSGVAINNCSLGLLLHSLSIFSFLALFHTDIPSANISVSSYIHKPVYSVLLRLIACTLFPCSVTISVTILLSLFCFFV